MGPFFSPPPFTYRTGLLFLPQSKVVVVVVVVVVTYFRLRFSSCLFVLSVQLAHNGLSFVEQKPFRKRTKILLQEGIWCTLIRKPTKASNRRRARAE